MSCSTQFREEQLVKLSSVLHFSYEMLQDTCFNVFQHGMFNEWNGMEAIEIGLACYREPRLFCICFYLLHFPFSLYVDIVNAALSKVLDSSQIKKNMETLSQASVLQNTKPLQRPSYYMLILFPSSWEKPLGISSSDN